MSLSLHNLTNKKKPKKRLGRGNASGHGTYCCRGLKGQRSRSGGKGGLKLKGFKQNLLNAPKFKGMKRRTASAQVVLLSALDKNFADNEKVGPGALLQKGLIGSISQPVKILVNSSKDKISKKLEVFGCAVSKSAESAILKAGGKIVEAVPVSVKKENSSKPTSSVDSASSTKGKKDKTEVKKATPKK
ncbi:50S ribosomal protein L15 [Candidatus Falkowbacteria bacterium]|jgi:large subunit ribosomal protein L15|nr:50S ribosomal protein L15 [Candidatus Falkowbacteria bacterium]MBT5503005.1 50S ribosomal protein L15 [Candidatus Falkowbacteria bacterium]MBT6574361.1 50S ribosomal protein L15 [Candidatus Falkowbacteria bacterium]MBT7349046.1 50S ribosomal protein L15 [Candidatus Falkowbacteria bacterium]MBT7500960.1 50S ribosomal protein L15 [Candidatus Falkowbacteria bacterium]